MKYKWSKKNKHNGGTNINIPTDDFNTLSFDDLLKTHKQVSNLETLIKNNLISRYYDIYNETSDNLPHIIKSLKHALWPSYRKNKSHFHRDYFNDGYKEDIDIIDNNKEKWLDNLTVSEVKKLADEIFFNFQNIISENCDDIRPIFDIFVEKVDSDWVLHWRKYLKNNNNKIYETLLLLKPDKHTTCDSMDEMKDECSSYSHVGCDWSETDSECIGDFQNPILCTYPSHFEIPIDGESLVLNIVKLNDARTGGELLSVIDNLMIHYKDIKEMKTLLLNSLNEIFYSRNEHLISSTVFETLSIRHINKEIKDNPDFMVGDYFNYWNFITHENDIGAVGYDIKKKEKRPIFDDEGDGDPTWSKWLVREFKRLRIDYKIQHQDYINK